MKHTISFTFLIALSMQLLNSAEAKAEEAPKASSTNSSSSPEAGKGGSASGESDKIDLKQLEQKYWSAKDDDFAVVQNRRYTKDHRHYLSLVAGPPISDPYSTGMITGFHYGYFFSERWGLDFEFTQANLHDNNATEQFITEHKTTPNHNNFVASKSLSYAFFPLYAKMSFLDKAIIYFDMGVSVGIGTVDYRILKEEGDETKSAFSYHITVTQQIFFSEHWALRADFTNRWTDEQLLRWAVTANSGSNPDRDHGTKKMNDTSLLLGVNYYF